MNQATLIFPHQLWLEHPGLRPDRMLVLVEDPLFFTQYAFHIKKRIFHRASMRAYEELLRGKGYQTRYVCSGPEAETTALFSALKADGITTVHCTEPDDYLLERRIRRETLRFGMALQLHDSPGFLMTRGQGEEWIAAHRMHQTDWYIHWRKQLGILMEPDGKPQGKRWTFDTENRQPFPAGLQAPPLPDPSLPSGFAAWAKTIQTDFPDAPGHAHHFEYPVSHAAAEKWLDAFIQQRLHLFGPYQDAMVPGQTFLFHSVLSPLLNSGLLTPAQVLQRTLDAAEALPVPLASLEGFIRQVLGWREFVRAVYHSHGVKQRTTNYLQHTNTLTAAFYQGKTGFFPFDEAFVRLENSAYSHHIERLMVQGNLLLLLGINPDNVYRWFMELFIDAYDWVMVPNVYGMSQYADGGAMVTKPYISGSPYLLRMGKFKKAPWCSDWDALYWSFLHQHRSRLAGNPRMAIPLASLKKMDGKMPMYLQTKEAVLQRLGLA
jgi:deoxyribodipyrimidine photolyase-related protein